MTAVRFLHTADVHLDTSFAGSSLPSLIGDKKREAIRATFRAMLEDARNSSVDFVLISGDLFEHDRITPDTVGFLQGQFESLAETRVFIAPGNHDPYLPGSPYREEPWPANVHIFTEEEFRPVEIEALGLRVTGFGFCRTHVPDRYFRKLPVLENDLRNIVIAHGSDVSRVPFGKSEHGPFSLEEITGKNVDYYALGHYHQQRRVENPVDRTTAWYPGIPEERAWDEEGSCGYLIGEIGTDGGVHIESRACNRYPLKTVTIACDGFSSREQILDQVLRLKGEAFNPRTILRIRLSGWIDPKLDLSFRDLSERLCEEVLHVVWDDQTEVTFDFEGLAREKTLTGNFVRMLNEQITRAGAERRPVLERTRLYGLQALLGREVQIR
jgi:DNA repair protein SbcD/Mre11